MPLTRLKRLALTLTLSLGMVGAAVAFNPSGVQADKTCNTDSCAGCGAGTAPCGYMYCCDSGDLPCDEDDSWTEECMGEPVEGEE